jgi:hypothetical protein
LWSLLKRLLPPKRVVTPLVSADTALAKLLKKLLPSKLLVTPSQNYTDWIALDCKGLLESHSPKAKLFWIDSGKIMSGVVKRTKIRDLANAKD